MRVDYLILLFALLVYTVVAGHDFSKCFYVSVCVLLCLCRWVSLNVCLWLSVSLMCVFVFLCPCMSSSMCGKISGEKVHLLRSSTSTDLVNLCQYKKSVGLRFLPISLYSYKFFSEYTFLYKNTLIRTTRLRFASIWRSNSRTGQVTNH